MKKGVKTIAELMYVDDQPAQCFKCGAELDECSICGEPIEIDSEISCEEGEHSHYSCYLMDQSEAEYTISIKKYKGKYIIRELEQQCDENKAEAYIKLNDAPVVINIKDVARHINKALKEAEEE